MVKKFFCIAFALVFIITLYGCRQQFSPETSSSTTGAIPPQHPTTEYTEPAANVPQQPMYAISLPIIREETADEHGNLLFIHTYRNISLVLPDQEVADKIIIDYLDRTDTTATAQSMLSIAKEHHTEASASALPYRLTTDLSPVRIDQSVLSLFGETTEYTGGAHSNETGCSVTYDMTTGNVITWEDILCQGASSEDFSTLLLAALSESNTVLFEGYEETVTEQFKNGFPNSIGWYMDTLGLCCYFSPYEIGPYSSGIITARIPYEKLTGILSDAYFPKEQDTHSGKFNIIPFDEEALGDFTQITELTLTENGSMYILYADGAISNFSISQEIAPYANSEYRYTCPIFATTTLTPGDAVVLKTDHLNSLSVTYTANGQTITKQLK